MDRDISHWYMLDCWGTQSWLYIQADNWEDYQRNYFDMRMKVHLQYYGIQRKGHRVKANMDLLIVLSQVAGTL